jgi:hypothetical protein
MIEIIKHRIIQIFLFLKYKCDHEKYLYSYLKLYCKDLKSGIRFYNFWNNNLNQYLLFCGYISLRAMSYHISCVIEKYETNSTIWLVNNNQMTNYISTKYGSQIYLNEWQ